MKIRILCAFICLMLSCTVSSSQANKDQADLIDKGFDYYQNEEYREALKFYNEAIALGPDTPDAAIAFYNIGNIHQYILDDPNTAYGHYTRTLEIDPDFLNGAASYKRGLISLDRQDFKKAVIDFTRAVLPGEGSHLLSAYLNRGVSYQNMDKPDQAIKDYDVVLSYDPGFEKGLPYYNRGGCYFEKSDFESAIQDYTSAISLDPENAYYYMDRGAAYQNLGNISAAEADYKKAVSLSPDDRIRTLVNNNLRRLDKSQDKDKKIKRIQALMLQWGQAVEKSANAMSTGNFRISDRFVDECLACTQEIRRLYNSIGVPRPNYAFTDAMDMVVNTYVNMGEFVAVKQNPTGYKKDINYLAELAAESYRDIGQAAVIFDNAGMSDLAQTCRYIKSQLDTIVAAIEKKLGCQII